MSCDDEPRATVAAHSSDPFATKALHGRLLRVSRLATMEGMAGGVAHELNQPLTAIVNYAHACDRLLARPGADLGEVREALRQIGLQTTRAAEVMQRLRQLAGRQHSQQAATSLNTLVAELLELLQTDARMHGVELSLELTAQLPEVIVDNGQIQQVILNFFRNSLDALAARAPRRSPRIVIRTSATAAHEVELAVSDNGPGFAPGVTSRLFDPFFSTKQDGTGLGLAISNTIARAHGGSVGFRSNQPHGVCFCIRLPARPARAATES